MKLIIPILIRILFMIALVIVASFISMGVLVVTGNYSNAKEWMVLFLYPDRGRRKYYLPSVPWDHFGYKNVFYWSVCVKIEKTKSLKNELLESNEEPGSEKW